MILFGQNLGTGRPQTELPISKYILSVAMALHSHLVSGKQFFDPYPQNVLKSTP